MEVEVLLPKVGNCVWYWCKSVPEKLFSTVRSTVPIESAEVCALNRISSKVKFSISIGFGRDESKGSLRVIVAGVNQAGHIDGVGIKVGRSFPSEIFSVMCLLFFAHYIAVFVREEIPFLIAVVLV